MLIIVQKEIGIPILKSGTKSSKIHSVEITAYKIATIYKDPNSELFKIAALFAILLLWSFSVFKKCKKCIKIKILSLSMFIRMADFDTLDFTQNLSNIKIL